jgi:hypothetical protein
MKMMLQIFGNNKGKINIYACTDARID